MIPKPRHPTEMTQMIVKGRRRKTAASPFFKSNRAWRDAAVANHFWVVSKTATFIRESFDSIWHTRCPYAGRKRRLARERGSELTFIAPEL